MVEVGGEVFAWFLFPLLKREKTSKRERFHFLKRLGLRVWPFLLMSFPPRPRRGRGRGEGVVQRVRRWLGVCGGVS